ncbi:hypothetical protein [Naumannella cuiyingiana]|uniref:Nidogen G2 beta-barrel domain-containing protein n=1 Tax=Naumannella cuiyingiana TaxID=1347891 RepID=A0A7Z0IJX8_9ACTN|nr:hypothetical protein [Naumannella cuiyingiana]NYI69877.1 hypothetical protein [Naumannella cuiyingiana]
MNNTQFAIIVGMALGAIAIIAGFVPLLITAIGGAVGWLVAQVVSGRIDVSQLTGRAGDRR